MEFAKSRGAASNQASERFGMPARHQDGDWRDEREVVDGPPVAVSTTITELRPKTILSYNQSPDIFFDRSVNPYNGCDHTYTVVWAQNQ